MPIAFNEETGEALRLDAGGAWVPTKIAENPKTGDRLALDGDNWVSVGGKPVDYAHEAGAVLAGLGRGAANLVGMVRDLPNAALSLAQSKVGDAYGIGPLARLLPEPEAEPIGGSASIKRALDPIGINTQATTPTGQVLSRVAEEVGTAVLPMGAVATLPARAAVRANPVVRMLGGTGTGDRVAQTAVSAGAGLGAGIAQQAAPGSQAWEFAGGLLGGLGTAGGLGGVGFLTQAVAPMVSQGGVEDVARSAVQRFASNPEALRDAPSQVLPGSDLTTAAAARDAGLAQLERALRNQPDSADAFVQRDRLRAEAQRGAIEGLAPEGGGAEDVAAMVRGRVQQFQDRTGQRVAGAQGAVDTRVEALGPGLDPVAAGRTVREELGGARDTAKRAESNLWQRLQDNEDLALEVGAGPANARKMLGEISPSAKPPSGDAAGVLEAAANLGGVVRWRELQDLRSWAAQTSSDLARAGDAVNKRRVDAVLRGIDDDIARAVGDDPSDQAKLGGSPGAGPAPSAPPRPSAGGPGPAAPSAVYTPDGQKIETEWRLVDLAGPDAPIVSHTPDFRPNPDYPADLQPRNRDRAASEAQIVRMAGELNPERLGAGGVGDGAPIIGPDRVTESGNGRLLAIDRAYRNGGRPAADYRAWIEGQGVDASGMQRPALVRVRTNELNADDRVRFTQSANAGPGLKLSPVEQAAIDARRVDDGTLSLYRGGALDDAANVDFARAFVKQAAPGDAGSLSTADGRLSLEGVRRMQAAMLARTYGDAPIVQTLLETGDDDIKALGRALADTAPMMAQLRAAIARGDVPAQFDPVATLTDAARVVQRARKDGVPIGDVLAQTDAFNPTNPHAAAFLGAAYGDGFRRVSYGRATEALRTYADEAMRQTGGDMFGPGPAAGDVWAAAQRRARGIGDDTAAGAGSSPAGAGSGGGGAAGAGGPVPAGGAGGGGRGGGSVVGDGLTPNFGPDDAAAYRAARSATAERKQTFDRGAPGQVLQQGGYNARGESGYAMPVEQVAGRFFNAGKSSRTDMAEFMRAAEGRAAAVEALRDFAVGDLRRAAVDDAGRVDPKRWAAWVAKHDGPLRSFPEVRREFANVAAAQRTVDRLASRRDQAVADFGKSGAGRFLDRDADAAFASVINSGNRTEGLRQLVRMAKGDADKLGHLRRAAVDHMLRSIENTGAVDAGGSQQLSAAKAIRFMGANGKAMQKSGLMSPGQIAVLRQVEEDLRRGAYVNTVGKPAGSNTIQNLSAAALLGRLSLSLENTGGGAVRNFFSGALGNTLGRAAGFLYKMPDENVRRLLTDAMLDPALMRDLMARATPERMETVWQTLGRRAARAGLITTATADGE